MKTMKKMKQVLCLSLALLMVLSLCACGASPQSAGSAAQKDAYYVEAPMEAPAEMEMARYDEYDSAGFAVAEEAAYGSSNTAEGQDAPAENPDKIIYSSDVTVETTDFDATLQALDAMVKDYGGWVESSSVNGANYYSRSRGYASNRSASYTLRIPSGRFDQLMNSLSTLGNVPYSHTYTENVTAQYYDVQAHLTAYKTQEARLLEMMEVAETVEDIILLEDRLTELRYRIESLQSSLNNWDRRVSYSSVYLSVEEVQVYTPEAETRVSFARQMWLSLKSGLEDVGEACKDFLLWFLEALPTLLILAVVILVAVILIRKGSARAKRKKQEKLAAQYAARQAALAGQQSAGEQPKAE